jgi:hypothetical protein
MTGKEYFQPGYVWEILNCKPVLGIRNGAGSACFWPRRVKLKVAHDTKATEVARTSSKSLFHHARVV